MKNFDRYKRQTENVENRLLNTPSKDLISDAEALIARVSRSRLLYHERAELRAVLWHAIDRAEDALRPKPLGVLEGGALISRRSTAALRLVAS